MIRRLFLEEGKIGLSKLLPTDASWLETWVNDPDTTRFMATGRTQATIPMIAAQIEAWKEPNDYPFAIALEDDPIGTVGLYGLDWISSKAEFRILIGAPYCGKGYGTAATKAMVRYGFDRLNLHRIWLGVTSVNFAAVHCYLKANFIEEGVLEDDLYRDGIYYHSTRMAITRPRYEDSKRWDTEKVKPAATLEPGPVIAKPVGGRSIGY